MTRPVHTPIILAVLIAALLAGAYLIVNRSGIGMNGRSGEAPSGFLH